MSKFEKDYTTNAISEGTINPKIIRQFFYNMKLKSYDYCHLIQQELIGLKNYVTEDFDRCLNQYEFMSGCFGDNKVSVSTFSVPYELVHAARRKAYKYSKYHNKILTYDDLSNGDDIFKYIPLMYINNKLYTDVRFKCRDDATYIYTKYRSLSSNAFGKITSMSTQLLANSLYDENLLRQGAITNKGRVAITRFKRYKRIAKEKFFIGYYERAGVYTFIKRIDVDKETNELVLHTFIPNYDGHRLIIIGLDNYVEHKDFGPEDKFFSLDYRKMPIPKDNLLIMIKSKSDHNYFPNSGQITITEYYPNIYEINNPDGYEFTMYVLYDDRDEKFSDGYDREIDFYLSRVNLLDRYKADTVPTVLKEYHPITWDYLIKDFHDKYTDESWFTEDKFNAFRYKLEKVSDIYRKWCLFFEVYARRTYGFMNGFLMDMSKVNLFKKLRLTTAIDIPQDSGIYKIFDKPQIVLSYKNTDLDGGNVSYIFYVDGRMRIPTYIVTYHNFTYVYLNKEYITPSSFIEVERFDGVRFAKDVIIKNDPVEVPLSFLNKTILTNAVFLVDKTGNYLNLDSANPDYLVTVVDTIGEFDIKNKDSVYILTPKCKLRITPLKDTAKNTNIELRCNNNTVLIPQELSIGEESYKSVELNVDKKINDVKYGVISRLRVYSDDGRMFSKNYISSGMNAFKVQQGKNVKSKITVRMTATHTPMKAMTLAYVGYDEKLIYKQDSIEPKNILNLEGKIKRPFSLTYYDVYLSGLKLNKHNIEIVSPFYIYFKNVDTVDDLEIYEKIRPEDNVYEFDLWDESTPEDEKHESEFLGDELFKGDETFKQDTLDHIEEIIPNPDVTPDLDSFLEGFGATIVDFLLHNNTNADESYEDLDDYEDQFDEEHSWRMYLNADHRITYSIPRESWTYLNHDWTLQAPSE